MTSPMTRIFARIDQQMTSAELHSPARLGRRDLLKGGAKLGLAAGTLAALGKTAVATPASAAAGTNTLFPGETLYPGQTLSGAGATLILQGDGNLVRYANGLVPWSSNTSGGNRLVMQGDGNLVLYSADYGQALWYSNSRYERAIQWFYDRMGTTGYEHQCEKAVENAFGIFGGTAAGGYGSAIINRNAQAQQNPYTAAPRGELVFYRTSSDGHVAISLGNGKIVSTSVNNRIGVAGISYFQNPLNWAYAPWR